MYLRFCQKYLKFWQKIVVRDVSQGPKYACESNFNRVFFFLLFFLFWWEAVKSFIEEMELNKPYIKTFQNF